MQSKRLTILLAALTLVIVTPLKAGACEYTEEVSLSLSTNSLQGGRANLWKALRYTVEHEPVESEKGYMHVTVEYQKKRDLFCDSMNCYFGFSPENNQWTTEMATSVMDNDRRLNKWYITMNYRHLRLGAPDDAGIADFGSGPVTGRLNPSTNTLTSLTVNAPGRLQLEKSSGDKSLTGC